MRTSKALTHCVGTRRGVRRRGCDVLTVQEDGRGGVDDPPLLDRAGELGRVMFSGDDDMLREATRRQRLGESFVSVIYAHQLRSGGKGRILAHRPGAASYEGAHLAVRGAAPARRQELLRMNRADCIPVVYSTVAPDALVRLLEADYELDSPVACKFWSRGFNDHYLVTASDTKYMLRIYSCGKYWIQSDSDIRFELDLLTYLHQRLISVSHPLPRRDGDFLGVLSAPEGTRPFSLFSYADGKAVRSLTEKHMQVVGRTVAELHRTADGFTTPHSRYHLDLELLIDRPLKLIGSCMGESRRTDFRLLTELAEQLKDSVLDLPRSGASYGVIHADVHEGNLHFIDDDECVFFDFDHCGYGWRAYEIAVSLTGESRENRDALLQGYQSVRRLDEAELAAIPPFMKIRQIWDVGDKLAMADMAGRRWINDVLWDRLLATLSAE